MDQKQQIVERLQQANNILVTVSNNPSVDQLASCIGLTILLNKMGKHATAVFSGQVPSTLEFLQPEKTLESNTDSLRDFIISLDKAKADKLRYKVEDKVVKIFITPYRTSITDKDLEFSQGDFNVDVVIALGVHSQADLDQAITGHGRILHDATIATINTKPGGELGSINWLVPGASSLCELAVDLVNSLDKQLIDAQVATALLTGIVAETARFSNEKTNPDTMSISAQLMAAGANQQLVATKLEQTLATVGSAPAAVDVSAPAATSDEAATPDGTLQIGHEKSAKAVEQPESAPEPAIDLSKEPEDITIKGSGDDKDDAPSQIHIDSQGGLHTLEPGKEFSESEEANDDAKPAGEQPSTNPTGHLGGSRMILQPPSMGGTSSGATLADDVPSSDPLSLPSPSDLSAPDGGGAGASGLTSAAPASPFMPPSMTPSGGAPAASGASLQHVVAPPVAPLPSALTPPPAPLQPSFSAPSAPMHEPPTPFVAPDATQMVPPDLVPTPPNPEPLQATAPVAAPPADDHLANARDAVLQAIASQPASGHPLEPIKALNAQPLGEPLRELPPLPDTGVPSAPVPGPSIIKPTDFSTPPANPTPPPPGPPPMMPPTQL